MGDNASLANKKQANSVRPYQKNLSPTGDTIIPHSSFLIPHSSFYKRRFLHKKSLAISAILCYTNKVCLKMQ